ncbi:hypothetical protein LT966_32740, partial [Streptomyces griseobrunneus]
MRVSARSSAVRPQQHGEGQEALRFLPAVLFAVFFDAMDFFEAAVFFAGLFLEVLFDGRISCTVA